MFAMNISKRFFRYSEVNIKDMATGKILFWLLKKSISTFYPINIASLDRVSPSIQPFTTIYKEQSSWQTFSCEERLPPAEPFPESKIQ